MAGELRDTLASLRGRSFGALTDVRPSELIGLLDLADDVKARRDAWRGRLDGSTWALIFEKHSTRTRVSFQVALAELGATSIFLGAGDIQLSRGEPISDTAKVLSRYVQGIVLRTYGHERFIEMASSAEVPVINALTDLSHPCQVLADLQTVRAHFGRLQGLELAWIGDGNNMAHSLALGAALCGMHVRLASPPGYVCQASIIGQASSLASAQGGSVRLCQAPAEAAEGAHVVVTDVFASMGQESEAAARLEAFAGYQVTEAIMARATDDAVFLHCLPAHRGEEVAAAVIDGPRSLVWDEAENRLHSSKALLLALHGGL